MRLIERAMERLAYQLGYTRIQSQAIKTAPVPEDCAHAPSEPPAAHLVHEQGFDYQNATADRNGIFHHRSEQRWSWAIGKREWMPITLAGFVLGGQVRQGSSLFAEAIDSRLWLPSLLCESWLAANKEAITSVANLEGRPRPLEDEENASVFVDGMFANLAPMRVSSDLRQMWRRCNPRDDGPHFLTSSREHTMLYELPVIQQAVTAPRAALDQLLTWTAQWLESRGCTVDRDSMLVRVEGYEPLFHIDDDPGGF